MNGRTPYKAFGDRIVKPEKKKPQKKLRKVA
jgi:hypothetical protein